jgi:virginiamycin B lyase
MIAFHRRRMWRSRQRFFRAAITFALCVSLLGSACCAVSADPAPGQIEEWPVPTAGRWGIDELGAGSEGYVWFLQGTDYGGANKGTIEGVSRSGSTAFSSLGEDALGVDITLGPEGNMWITEPHMTESNNMEELDTIGRLELHGGSIQLTEFPIGQPAIALPCGCGPLGIASGTNGHIWFTDLRPDPDNEIFVGEMDTSGRMVAQHLIPAGSGLHEASSPLPHGIAAGPEGSVWFTDDGANVQGRNLIGRIDAAGVVEEFPIPTPGAEPAAIVAGTDGAMWFTEPGKRKIGRITSTGEVTEFAVPDVSSALNGLVLGAEGNLWFAERQPLPGFGSISPSGEVRSYHPLFEPDSYVNTEAIGPYSLTLGTDGDIWFTDPRPRDELDPDPTTDEGRFAIPLPPRNTQPPVIQGSPTPGAVLAASSGAWANAPTSESYQWQRCSDTGTSCQSVPEETGPSYLLSAADVGTRLRVVVTASNEAGSTAADSEPTPLVQPVAPSTVNVEPYQAHPGYQAHQAEALGATIVSLLSRTRGGVTVHALVLHGVNDGSTVTITCRGAGCALARASRGRKAPQCKRTTCTWSGRVAHGPTVGLTSLMRAMRLQSGARLTVVVTLPGSIGRAFEFRVARRGVPSPLLSCRAVGSIQQVAAC